VLSCALLIYWSMVPPRNGVGFEVRYPVIWGAAWYRHHVFIQLGSLLIIPNHFAILISALLAFAPWIPWFEWFRFRTIVIAMILIAIAMVLAGWINP
jgi:hypothetical protein